MKKLFTALIVLALVLLCAAAMAEVDIDGSFPDPVFNRYVRDRYDHDGDGFFNNSEVVEIQQVKEIRRYQSDIKDMTGIALFRNLEVLEMTRGELEKLDVSGNQKLVEMIIDHNKLTSLTLGKQPCLKKLDVNANRLTSLDLKHATALEELSCEYNRLGSLDVSATTSLKLLLCSNNGLTSLKLGSQKNLARLVCLENNLRSLDISKCPKLNAFVTGGEPDYETSEVMVWGKSADQYLEVDGKVTLTTTKGRFNAKAEKITIDQKKVTLTRTAKKSKPTVTLKAAVEPADTRYKEVKWSSSDPAVAKVNSKTGKVTAVKAGKATITCTATDGSGVKATCVITVKNVPVKEITLDKKEVTLTRTAKKLNPTVKLKVKKILPEDAPDKAVVWMSSNPKVAKVDPKTGKVTALKAGKATITCWPADVEGVKTKVKASCVVTVKNTLVKAITLNKKTAQLAVGKTLKLKIKKITPSDAVKQDVKWNSSNKKVATVDKNGKVTAVKAGTCMIICTAKDGSKVFAICKLTVK